MRNERRTSGSEKGARKPVGESRTRRRAPIHHYRRTAITLADGSSAETYLLTPAQVEDRPLIASGNWRGRRREKVG